MSLRRHVCCVPLRLNAPKDHIWVSEDVLNSAMRHFAHGRIPRRHVGLAPGPLEARKRATKRRMMNLAQVGGGEGFDPGVLPGLGAPERVDWTWQSPTPLLPRRSDGTRKPSGSMACWYANYEQKSTPYQLGSRILPLLRLMSASQDQRKMRRKMKTSSRRMQIFNPEARWRIPSSGKN